MPGTFVRNGEHINRARRPALAYSLMWTAFGSPQLIGGMGDG